MKILNLKSFEKFGNYFFLIILFFGIKLASENAISQLKLPNGFEISIYASDIEATKITSDWFLWMHHTINEIPSDNIKKYKWQKKHNENMSGTSKAYKPNKIEKNTKFKNYETWKN